MLKRTRRLAALLSVGAIAVAALPMPAHADPADTAKCVAGSAVDFAKKTINHQPYLPHNC
jgi:hypothetical protein